MRQYVLSWRRLTGRSVFSRCNGGSIYAETPELAVRMRLKTTTWSPSTYAVRDLATGDIILVNVTEAPKTHPYVLERV